MKIISLVGFRHSGKTTTVEVLIRELKKRGFKVGTVKSIHCPSFEIEEKKNSNTMRHKKAGADVVCASAKEETAFIYSKGLEKNEIFEKLDVDYLILEGDYQSDVPRIICAHEEAEIPEKITEKTFLVSGRIADRKDMACGFPAVSALKDPERLAEKVIEAAYDVELPVKLLPVPEEVTAFCHHTCMEGCERTKKDVLPKRKNVVPRHIFLTGEKQIGKSTIWKKVLEELNVEYRGFITCPYELNGEKKGFYMHALGQVPAGCCNDVPISVRVGEQRIIPVTETFDTFGADIIKTAVNAGPGLIIMDELGRLEKNAHTFQKEVNACLNSPGTVIGVLRKADSLFIEEIKARPDVLVYEVTEANRDVLPEELVPTVRKLIKTTE